MDNNTKVKAQVSLEFTVAFICTILFLIGTVQLFVWFGSNIVQRQKAYENSRKALRQEIPCLNCLPVFGAEKEYELIMPKEDFYTPSKLNILFKKQNN